MSKKHPIISVTGSSGAGTSTVKDHVRADFPPRKGQNRCHPSRATRSTSSTAPTMKAELEKPATPKATTPLATSVYEANAIGGTGSVCSANPMAKPAPARNAITCIIRRRSGAALGAAVRCTFTDWEDIEGGTLTFCFTRVCTGL